MSALEVILLIFFIVAVIGWILSIQYHKSILLYLADAYEEKAEAYEESIKKQRKSFNVTGKRTGKTKYANDFLRDIDIKSGKAQGLRDARKYILYELQDYN